MKNSLFLTAALVFSSALYAQQPLTRQAVEELFAQYNPQLMDRSSKEEGLRRMVEEVISACMDQNPTDALENRYTVIALARNFENSLILQAVTEQYQQALTYAALGNPEVDAPARAHAHAELLKIYARIWAVTVQVKEDLLAQYKQALGTASRDKDMTPAERKEYRTRLKNTIVALQADIDTLQSKPEALLLALTKNTLDKTEEQARAQLNSSAQISSDNLLVKTKHKKPVAE